jgi:hypothetical protein
VARRSYYRRAAVDEACSKPADWYQLILASLVAASDDASRDDPTEVVRMTCDRAGEAGDLEALWTQLGETTSRPLGRAFTTPPPLYWREDMAHREQTRISASRWLCPGSCPLIVPALAHSGRILVSNRIKPRRIVPLLALALAGALACMTPGSAWNQSRTLPIMNFSGMFGEAVDKCLNAPFLEQTGIKVVTESPGDYGKMAALAKAGVIDGMLTDDSTSELSRTVAQGLLEPIDWKAVDPLPMYPKAKNEYAFGASYHSTVMAWRSDAKAPANFAEFFDVEKLPGTRAPPDYPDYVLEFDALADGMTTKQVTKGIDLNRAFNVLERVKKNVIWWQSGAQPAQLLKDNKANTPSSGAAALPAFPATVTASRTRRAQMQTVVAS